jgi:hypothetical protein
MLPEKEMKYFCGSINHAATVLCKEPLVSHAESLISPVSPNLVFGFCFAFILKPGRINIFYYS